MPQPSHRSLPSHRRAFPRSRPNIPDFFLLVRVKPNGPVKPYCSRSWGKWRRYVKTEGGFVRIRERKVVRLGDDIHAIIE